MGAVLLKRFTRLTIAHSKRLRNLETAVSLFVAFFNFCRVHETLCVTPAMAAGLTDHVWTMAELLSAAFGSRVPPPAAPEAPRPTGMSAARGKGEKRGSGPSRWHRGLRVMNGVAYLATDCAGATVGCPSPSGAFLEETNAF